MLRLRGELQFDPRDLNLVQLPDQRTIEPCVNPPGPPVGNAPLVIQRAEVQTDPNVART